MSLVHVSKQTKNEIIIINVKVPFNQDCKKKKKKMGKGKLNKQKLWSRAF